MGASRVFILFLFHFSMKVKIANRIAPDGTPRIAASHLGLFFLPISYKKDAMLIWVNLSVVCWYSKSQILKTQTDMIFVFKLTFSHFFL